MIYYIDVYLGCGSGEEWHKSTIEELFLLGIQ